MTDCTFRPATEAESSLCEVPFCGKPAVVIRCNASGKADGGRCARHAPKQIAYLVVGFKLEGTPPVLVFKGVDIFSEPDPSHDARFRTFVVHTEDDVTYDGARRRLLATMRSSPELAWTLPHFKERG